jgi:nucleotide-binding universal stress UspA family protein
MYTNIVIPVALDHEHEPSLAVSIAKNLLAEGGKITLLTVVEPIAGYVASYMPKGQMEKNRQETKAELRTARGDDETIEVAVITGHPGSSIVDYAKEVSADLIVISSHKPGLQDFFLGSTAARVVRYSQCSVHVLR